MAGLPPKSPVMQASQNVACNPDSGGTPATKEKAIDSGTYDIVKGINGTKLRRTEQPAKEIIFMKKKESCVPA
eukprot:scaffold17501_cov140-Amphora_coffeaeformis.AAC.2